MAFAAVARGAAGAVTDNAVEQRAAEDIGGSRKTCGQKIASADDYFMFHYKQ